VISARSKAAFFDRPAVLASMDAATLRVLSRFGRFTQRRMQTSMTRAKTVSQPGKPPHAHAGNLRDLIWFAFDAPRRSVVIGPLAFRDGIVPKLLEEGGVVVARLKGRWGKDYTKRMVYRARPFAKPAFDAEMKAMPGAFKGSMKK